MTVALKYDQIFGKQFQITHEIQHVFQYIPTYAYVLPEYLSHSFRALN